MTDVLISCKDELDAAVDGVLIRIYNAVDVFVTSGTSGDGGNPDGERLFNLSSGNYSMRLSMSTNGYSIVSPQAFTVTGVPADDIFDVSVNLFSLPNSTDTNYCRCSGYFKDMTGAPIKGKEMWFVHLNPHLVSGSVVLGSRKLVFTDADGYAQVDLIRDGIYRVELPDYADIDMEIRVPSAASASLPYVIFPIVSSFTPSSATSAVAVGATDTLTVTVTYKSGLALPLSDFAATGYPISFSSSDTDVATVAISGGSLVITGVAAGSATITATRVYDDTETQLVEYPATAAVTGSIAVTVT